MSNSIAKQIVFTLALGCAAGAQADGSGKVKFNDFEFTVADAIAYPSDDGVDVALLSGKLNRKEVAKDGKVDSFDVMRTDGPRITLNVPTEGDLSCIQFSNGAGGGGSCNSDYAPGLKITSKTKDRIVGSFKLDGEKDQIDVQFDLPIETVATRAGSALPANGGEPGKAVMAHFGAIEKGDFKALKATALPEKRAMMEASEKAGEAKEMFEFMRKMMPKKVKVIGGVVDGDSATVDFSGMEDGKPVKGSADLSRVDGKWYVDGVNL